MGKDLKGKELGSGIYQKNSGLYVGRHVNRFGKRIEVSSRDIKDLKQKLSTVIFEDKNHLNIIDSTVTLDEWFEKWLGIYKYNVIRANTKRHYLHVYRKHISSEYGKMKLTEITQLQIRALIKKLVENGYQFETQNKVRIMLLDMFNKAMIDDFVHKNPAKGIKLTRNEDKDLKVLTSEEQSEFYECCKGTFYNNLFIVAVSTGLRPGELCALTWNDIDLDKMEINVNKTLLYQKLEGDDTKTFHLEKPKTNSSYRKVPINKQCMLALKKQKMQKNVIMSKTPKKVDDEFSNFLFTTKYGTPINSVIYNDAIRKIIDEINLSKDTLDEMEYFSAHCFRHTFATRCFEAGIQPKTVQSFLGHATLQMTMDLYTHVLETQKATEMEKLENSLDNLLDVSDDQAETKCLNYEKKIKAGNKVRYLNVV